MVNYALVSAILILDYLDDDVDDEYDEEPNGMTDFKHH
jgi:hypothetical protein